MSLLLLVIRLLVLMDCLISVCAWGDVFCHIFRAFEVQKGILKSSLSVFREPNGCYFPQMPQLEKKLEFELEDGARVIACRFPFPHWTPDHTTGEGIDTVWAYDMSACRTQGKRAWLWSARPVELGRDSGLWASSSETQSQLLDTEWQVTAALLEKMNRSSEKHLSLNSAAF